MGRRKCYFVIFGILIFPTLQRNLQIKVTGAETLNIKVKFHSRIVVHNWYF